MRWPSWKTVRRQFPRRLCASVTLLAYLATVLGLPLPARAARKDQSQPFPCQDNPCGCLTAEECWRGCCCFTPAQRWAWARQHGVTPPAYAERPPQNWRTTRLRDQAEGKSQAPAACSCCARPGQQPTQPVARAASSRPGQSKAPSCCTPRPTKDRGQGGKPSSAQAKKPSKDAPPTTGRGSRWALGASALRCRGLNTLWASTGAALPATAAAPWGPSLDAVSWLSCRHDASVVHVLTPPEPPPRLPGA